MVLVDTLFGPLLGPGAGLLAALDHSVLRMTDGVSGRGNTGKSDWKETDATLPSVHSNPHPHLYLQADTQLHHLGVIYLDGKNL